MTLPLSTLDELVGKFDTFLVDVFGVLLGVQGVYPYAADTLSRLTAAGKRVILLSNSGKRAVVNISRITGYGIPRDSFETLLSSGEVAFGYLNREIGQSIKRGTKVLLVSRGGDFSAVDGLDLTMVESPDEAEMIFLSGCDSETVPLEMYTDMLCSAAIRGVPCLCSNPDLATPVSGGMSYGTGRIAQTYQQMGGQVQWIGKPYPMIYEAVYRLLNHSDRNRILCVGDSPAHDILGGQQAGFVTALVRTGIHAGLSNTEIAEMCYNAGTIPDYTLASFCF